VAIPYIDVNRSPDVYQRSPAAGIHADALFVGTAHAVRRELFLRLGGYREYLFHQGEERDFTIRMLAAGYIVRQGLADPIHHFESPRRDFRRLDLFGRRNDILYSWFNVPMPYFPLHLLATTLNGLKAGWQTGRMARMSHGMLNGYGAMFNQFNRRRPVSRAAYRLSRSLKDRRGVPLKDIEAQLRELAAAPWTWAK